MTSNFHVKTQRRNQNLHINLHGVFDGASAFELINVIQQVKNQCVSVFIDTNRLTRTYSFGKAVLNSHLPKNFLRARLHFSGIQAEDIIPDGCTLFRKKKDGFHKYKGNCKDCHRRNEKNDERPPYKQVN